MLTQEQFIERLKNNPYNIKTNTIYNGNDTLMDCICPYGHKYKTKAFALIYSKSNCLVCTNKIIQKGINDLCTTEPKIAELLWNKEDGYKYTKGSGKKVFWKCPNCGQKLYKSIDNVRKHGLICNSCYDGISYPNRFMFNVLSQLQIDFVSEYIIDGASYRYDFYIKNKNIIIEVQGKQHYSGWQNLSISLDEIQKNDFQKKEYALKNGILNYIEIDAREDDRFYIQKSILNSPLASIFDFSKVNWNVCYEKSLKSFVKIVADLHNKGLYAYEIARETGHSETTIRDWLIKAESIGLCTFSKSRGFLNDSKEIILVNNGCIYKSITKAAKYYNLSVQNLSAHLNGKRQYCGKDINGNPLIWRFTNNYLNETYEELLTQIKIKKESSILQYSLDGRLLAKFPSFNSIKKELGFSDTNIRAVCKYKRKTAYGYIWRYENDPMVDSEVD